MASSLGPLNSPGSIPAPHDGEKIAKALQTYLCKWEGRQGTIVDVADAIVFALGGTSVSDKRKAGFLRFFSPEQLEVLKARIHTLRGRADVRVMERIFNTAIVTTSDETTKNALLGVKAAFLSIYPQISPPQSRGTRYTPTYQPLPPIAPPQHQAQASASRDVSTLTRTERAPAASSPAAARAASATARPATLPQPARAPVVSATRDNSTPAREQRAHAALDPAARANAPATARTSTPTPPQQASHTQREPVRERRDMQSPEDFLREHMGSLSISGSAGAPPARPTPAVPRRKPAPHASDMQTPEDFLREQLSSASTATHAPAPSAPSRARSATPSVTPSATPPQYQSPLEFLAENLPSAAAGPSSAPAPAARAASPPTVNLRAILGEIWERAESTPLNHLIGGRLAQCYDTCHSGASSLDFSHNPALAKALLYYILNADDRGTAVSRYEDIYAKLDLRTNPGHRGMDRDSLNLHNVPKKLLNRDSHEAAPSNTLQDFLRQLFNAANIE